MRCPFEKVKRGHSSRNMDIDFGNGLNEEVVIREDFF